MEERRAMQSLRLRHLLYVTRISSSRKVCDTRVLAPERFRGSLLGLAVGDALGAPIEGSRRGSFPPVRGFESFDGSLAHQRFPEGCWTDDTSMALCLAESLINCKGFDPTDQMKKYVQWMEEGYLSCLGPAFGIGITVKGSLLRFKSSPINPFCGPTDPFTAGNGCIMRLAPIALFYAKSPDQAIQKCGESSRTTHQARTAIDSCKYFGGILVGAARGEKKQEILSNLYSPLGNWKPSELVSEVEEVAKGSFRRKGRDDISASGFVVRSLEAALWAFHNSE
ncbi:MAG: ADP-ribosylglycohydrolase family protein, partial [Rhabdochlamydiaceae bacterium]